MNATNSASPISAPSSIFDAPSDPLESARDDLRNTTETAAMPSTLAPSESPTPTTDAPSPTASQSLHAGPHFWPSYSPPSWLPPSHTHQPPAPSSEAANFNEFLAFVGWYAFLIVCCLVPTACAYQRRRRNARILHQSLQNMQRRLDHLDRMGGLDGLVEGSAAQGFRGGEMLDLGENRNRDWEFLEQLFGSPAGGAQDRVGADVVHLRRRAVLADVLTGMSVRMMVEREERRRAERGARLVAALKETSLEVKECHLIMKHVLLPENNSTLANDVRIDLSSLREGRSHTNNCINDAIDVEPQSTSCSDTGRESTLNAENRDEIAKDQGTDFESNSDNMLDPEREKPPNDDKCHHHVDAVIENATGTTLQPSCHQETMPPCISALPSQASEHLQNINPLSLYEVDDLYHDDVDDDDDDNPYTALRIPCTDHAREESTASIGTAAPPSGPQSVILNESRLVPPTCAICLTHYDIGCYVSWSSNKECTHVFHRDCILMWLLKKEELLCPCCRRDFVPSCRATTREPGSNTEFPL